MATIAKHIYNEKLKDINWQKKKNSIQIRDEFTCQKCGSKEGFLNVHHRHYLPGRDPWDYPDQLLILLCEDCHKDEEDCKDILTEMIPVLHYWGYLNTEIRDIVNNLIQAKIPPKENG
jgi:hypothetical protein